MPESPLKRLTCLLAFLLLWGGSCSTPASGPASVPDPEDTTPPLVSGSPSVTPVAGGLLVTWPQAWDNVTAASYLQYRLTLAESGSPLASVASQLLLSPAKDWTQDLTSWTFSSLIPGKTYWIGVLVTDGAGNRTAYPPASGAVPEAVEAYYSSVVGLTGSAFKAALHTILATGTKKLTYAEVWSGLDYCDEDPQNVNHVLEIYTGWSVPKTAKSQNNQANYWNREHVWAKSHGDFGTDPGPGTDLHHLRAADASINSLRSNNDFDVGGDLVTDATPYGSYLGATKNRIRGSSSWEPRDEDKGDIARMMFYMAVRYEAVDGVDLELNEAVGNESAPYIGKLSVLKAWNTADPVDDWEKRRNDRVQELQGNRNPFIDHPDWVSSIW